MKLIFNEANIRKKEELRKVFLKAEAEDTKIGEEKISEDCLMIRKPIWIWFWPDCVIHFAALKSVGQSVAKPLEYYANNVTGSANLLEVISI